MRIINIRSKNINALKAENEIDFTQPYFQDKIFAIVGKTGAGKSTLLDIITLALYAQTSRLGTDTVHTISQGSETNFCEVTFEHQGITYRSHLHQEKSDGKLKQEMWLKKGEETIAQEVEMVSKKIEQLTGLNFQRFRQSMLLPQGLFNQFLYAPSQERLALLEKMHDTKIYAKISKEVYATTQKEQHKLQEMEHNFKDLRHLSTQERQKIEQRLQELKEERDRHNLSKLTEQITQKRLFDQQMQELEEQKHALENLQKRLIAKQFEEKEYHDFLQFSVQEKKKIEQSKLLDHELEFNQKNLEQIQSEIQLIEKELQEVNQTIQEREDQLSKLHVKETLIKKELENFPNIVHLQQNFTLIKSKFNERLAYQKELQNLTQIEEDLSEAPLTQEIDTLQARRNQLEKEIKSQNIEKVKQEHLILEKQLTKLQERASLEAEKNELINSKEQHNKELEEFREEYKRLVPQIQQLQQSIQQLEEKQRLEEKILNYEEERAKLKEGEPCPLCGSTQHPLFSNEITPNKTKEILHEQQDSLKALQNQAHKLEQKIAIHESTIARLKEEIEAKSQALVPLQHIKGEVTEIATQQATLQKTLHGVSQQRNELNFINERITQAKEELLDLRVRIQKNNTRKRVEEELKSKIQELNYYLIKTLKLYNITLDAHSIQLLKQQRDQYQKLSLELKELQQSIHPIEGEKLESLSKRSYIEERLRSLQKRSSMQSCDILLLQQNRFAILGDKDTQTYSQELTQQGKERQESYDQFLRLKDQFNQKKAYYFSMLEDLEKRQKLKLLNLEKLEQEREALEVKLGLINQEIGAIEQQIEQDNEYIQREKQGLNRIEEQKEIVAQWQQLNDLIGSQDGQKYQRYVQGKNLEELIDLANQHLQSFSKRYRLQIKDPLTLELEILDQYFNNQSRAIATLSGGESFIVSLALALALIDLNTQELELNTLFLDEGFETLDEESLQDVLEVLSKIKREGKIIGIISHTPLLQEVISTKILLQPQGNGESQLEIHSS